jgi:SAM-dependent methyltransferase
MNKDINDINFWKHRLQTAADIHQSVFNCTLEQWKQIEKNHLRVILNHIDVKNDIVLDVGCGYGRNYVSKITNYTGIDLSPDFIQHATNTYPEKTFIQTTIINHVPNKKYNWAICSSIKRMIQRENGLNDWTKNEEHLKKICNNILILEYTEAFDDSYIATEIIKGY